MSARPHAIVVVIALLAPASRLGAQTTSAPAPAATIQGSTLDTVTTSPQLSPSTKPRHSRLEICRRSFRRRPTRIAGPRFPTCAVMPFTIER